MPKTWCLKCGADSASSYCDDCRPGVDAKRMQRRFEEEPHRSIYYTPEWDVVRRKALRRDGFRCRYLLEDGSRCPVHDRSGLGLQVHHIEALEEGGEPYDLLNLVTLCLDHHAEVDAERRRRKRALA
jgi:5-methylcytosine-specific restriction endonuclease McrA